MKLEVLPISCKCRGKQLTGKMVMINPYGCQVTMESPYEGLVTQEFYSVDLDPIELFDPAYIKGRGEMILREMYKLYHKIKGSTEMFREILEEWNEFGQHSDPFRKQLYEWRNQNNPETRDFIDFCLDFVDDRARGEFESLFPGDCPIPYCLSHEFLKRALQLIDEEESEEDE